jgi:N-methylhydantoinase B
VFPLMGNDALYVRWNGGGGIGDPLDRPAEKVLADVDAGLISERAATDIYGIVRKDGALDQSATQAKRAVLCDARLSTRAVQ